MSLTNCRSVFCSAVEVDCICSVSLCDIRSQPACYVSFWVFDIQRSSVVDRREDFP